MRQYLWPARGQPIRLLLLGWCLSYAGDLAAFTAASVYVYHVGGAAYVGLLGLLKALPGALLVPLVASWSDRVRRERLLAVSVALRALLLAAAAAVMTGDAQAILVLVLVGLEAGLASVFRQVQAALLPWLARTPDELTRANTAVGVMQSAAMLGGPALAAGLLAVIIQDGQPGERFYMITDGRVRVCKDGKELRQMGTGESFGEIALLRQVPRTATVIAMSRLQARTLTRDEFLSAVTGNAASAEGADEVISARLQAG